MWRSFPFSLLSFIPNGLKVPLTEIAFLPEKSYLFKYGGGILIGFAVGAISGLFIAYYAVPRFKDIIIQFFAEEEPEHDQLLSYQRLRYILSFSRIWFQHHTLLSDPMQGKEIP